MNATVRAFRTYPTLLRSYWALALEYRSQLIFWVLSGVFPLVMMAAWLVVARQQNGSIEGYDATDLISYFLAATFLRRLGGIWLIWDIDQDIRMGTLSPKLLRPIDPAHMYFSEHLARKPLHFTLLGIPIAIVSILLGARYDLSPLNLLFITIATFGSILIEFYSQMAIGALGFWITQVLAVVQVWFYARALLSGVILPLDFFPEAVRTWIDLSPFPYTLGFPVEVVLGRLSLMEIGRGLLAQYLWVLILFVLYRLLWVRGLKRYSAVGA